MKRRVCFLLLLSVFMCSILTACSGSGGAVSGPNNSYSSQYNSWNISGHNAILIIQYGDSALAYVYSTESREVTVVR